MQACLKWIQKYLKDVQALVLSVLVCVGMKGRQESSHQLPETPHLNGEKFITDCTLRPS